MQTLDPPRSQATRGPIPRKSDSECFSDRTEKTKEESLKCACGEPALGARPIEFRQSVVGKAIGLFQFECEKCRTTETFAINCAIMYPAWKVVIQQAPGLFWLRHLTEGEQNDRVR